jgi:hypothetical protein
MNTTRTINIGKDFSRYPVGRTREDGESNGERFREDFLRPALVQVDVVNIEFDDALGYNSSFLEEVFGGLIRNGFTKEHLANKIKLVTKDDSLLVEIKEYMESANA